MFRLPAACALLLVAALSAAPAQSQIRRCVNDDGTHVYTDRACADLDASERLPRPAPGGAHEHPIRRDCSRRLHDLVFELTAAIDARDVNRLAALYHWPGMSSRSGYALMARLDAIVNRPLVDITPLHPQPPEPVPPVTPPPAEAQRETRVWRTLPRSGAAPPTTVQHQVDHRAHLDASSGAAGGAPDTAAADAAVTHATVPPQPDPPRRPTGLVLDQTAANGVTPLRTVFSLRRHLGCWWVSL